jgi:hypothetical protein
MLESTTTTVTLVIIQMVTHIITQAPQPSGSVLNSPYSTIPTASATYYGHSFPSSVSLSSSPTWPTVSTASSYAWKPTSSANNYFLSIIPTPSVSFVAPRPSMAQEFSTSSSSSGDNRTVMALSVLLAITSTLLAAILVTLYRRRRPRASRCKLGGLRRFWAVKQGQLVSLLEFCRY